MWGKKVKWPIKRYRDALRKALDDAYDSPPDQDTLEKLAQDIERVIDDMDGKESE